MKLETIENLKKIAFISLILGVFLLWMEIIFFIFIITGDAFINPETIVVSSCLAFGYGSVLYLTIGYILYHIISKRENIS